MNRIKNIPRPPALPVDDPEQNRINLERRVHNEIIRRAAPLSVYDVGVTVHLIDKITAGMKSKA
jgi:hypothetical protein